MFGSASPIESYMHIRILAPLSTFNKSSTGYMLGDKNRQYVIPLSAVKTKACQFTNVYFIDTAALRSPSWQLIFSQTIVFTARVKSGGERGRIFLTVSCPTCV